MIYISVMWKTVFSFLLLWALCRLEGKSQISQLTLFDYITGITIGSMAANIMMPDNPVLPLALGMALWSGLSVLFHWLNQKGRAVQRVVDGIPMMLVRNGRIEEGNLRKSRISLAELEMMLREKGFFNLSEVESAIMETDGKLSVLPRSRYRPVQPRDLGLHPGYEGVPHLVVQEGRVISRALAEVGLPEDWLHAELARQGIHSTDQVFAAWLGTDGRLTVDHRNGHG